MFTIYFGHPEKLPGLPKDLRIEIIKYIAIDEKANISFSLAKDPTTGESFNELADLEKDGELPLFLCWSTGLISQYLNRRNSLASLEFTGSGKGVYRFSWVRFSKCAVFHCNLQGVIERVHSDNACVNGLKFISIGIPAGVTSLQGNAKNSISDFVAVTSILSRFTGPLLNGYVHFGKFRDDSSSSESSFESEDSGGEGKGKSLKKKCRGIFKRFRKVPEIVVQGPSAPSPQSWRSRRAASFSFTGSKKKEGSGNDGPFQRRKSTDSIESRSPFPKSTETSLLSKALEFGNLAFSQQAADAKAVESSKKHGKVIFSAEADAEISTDHESKATESQFQHDGDVVIGDGNPAELEHNAHNHVQDQIRLKEQFFLPESAITDAPVPETPNVALSSKHKFYTPIFPENTVDGRMQAFKYVSPANAFYDPEYFNQWRVPYTAMSPKTPVTPDGFVYPLGISKESDVGPDDNPHMHIIRGFEPLYPDNTISKQEEVRLRAGSWANWDAVPPFQASLDNLLEEYKLLLSNSYSGLPSVSSCTW